MALASLVLTASVACGEGGAPASAPVARPARPAPGATAPPASLSARNPFEYEVSRVATPTPAPVARVARPASPPPTTLAPRPEVELVGFVTRAGRPRAVLRADGQTFVSGVGDRIGRYVVTSIDDESVRLRRSDGGEDLLLRRES